ncbi:helix-turn-helix domain-containing protein [Paenibacillus mucilaginosus]|uniref:YesN8 n=2 Tax=Paenibacillus mucilaginosus TaxID=61624 RepID=H6NL14_9BACL|nr:helix-turn-helix domain-containing protein [Paenibacillus mucilaginosus]AEI40710.1 YesN8 [Paenibacillus mucilaginosus KNP414]AFC29320.1 YesN8 [Paenibacillus mucilaginosus 3016]MCG7211807.1 response regulator [Paenibacillus mucilaginosus]WDM29843.1 response regulator [Paenibacillus mucilaginosus]WFA18038.1 response regulator [Paenibacillus mucilaginosus]
MTYSVMIVDDEPEIRLGLRLKVEWDSPDLTVACEAANGMEALGKLAGEAVDIVITDMNMPVMNGVSFLESCHELYPGLKLIVITGYEDFHYARAAVRTHARDYLLKPVSQEELTAALRKVVRELDEEKSRQVQQEKVQWRLSQDYKEMKEHFLTGLVKEEGLDERAVTERSKWFELEAWAGRKVRFVTAGLRERGGAPLGEERTPDKLRTPFELLCREYAQTYPAQPLPVFRDGSYPGLMHFIAPAEPGAAEAFAEGLRKCAGAHLAFEPAVGIGGEAEGFGAWKEGYMSSLVAWNMAGSHVDAGSREHPDTRAEGAEDTAKVIRRHLIRGELDSFAWAVRRELEDAIRHSRGHLVKRIFGLYLLLDAIGSAGGVQLDSADQLWVRPDKVLALDTVEKAAAFLTGIGRRIQEGMGEKPEDAEGSVIRAAKAFIEANYMYELHLTMLAERFNYNPSYFSELFKAKVGKTFIQYVTEVRMAQALKLLEESELSLWDIAELTGFSNPSYFSSKFKKMYGVTPSEYRQKPEAPTRKN